MFSQMANDYGFWQSSDTMFNGNDELEPFSFDHEAQDALETIEQEPVVETISPILTVSIPPFPKSEFDDPLMVGSMSGLVCGSSYSLDVSDTLSPNSLLSSVDSNTVVSKQLDLERDIGAADEVSLENVGTPTYKKLPRQGRYSQSPTIASPETTARPAGPSSSSPSATAAAPASPAQSEHKKVSDSRLSAQGLAKVLKLDSPEEALKRERYILDIFENELHYPLGYKTWVRDTFKDYRVKLIDQLHERVKHRYPEYDHSVLETIIRRATYYMMQSRLRRERRARAKGIKLSRSNANSP